MCWRRHIPLIRCHCRESPALKETDQLRQKLAAVREQLGISPTATISADGGRAQIRPKSPEGKRQASSNEAPVSPGA